MCPAVRCWAGIGESDGMLFLWLGYVITKAKVKGDGRHPLGCLKSGDLQF